MYLCHIFLIINIILLLLILLIINVHFLCLSVLNSLNYRSRLTSTGEDEREYQSEHETSWDDEFDDRYDNFTAGRERLQEFNGRIPPRKKKKDVPKPKPEKKVSGRIFFKIFS